MQFNKLKFYNPTESGGASVLDQPFSYLWATDTTKGRSAASIYSLVQSLGNFSNIIVVDAVYGNDSYAGPPMQAGQRESVIRPFKDINIAIYSMQQGDVMVVMPGTYAITNFPGLVPKNNTTFLLINATLTYGGNYSPFFTYPTPAYGVKVIGVGNSSIVKTTQNGWGGVITPYTGMTEIRFYNLTLTAPGQAVASVGSAGSNERIVEFYDCTIFQNDSQINTSVGGGAVGVSLLMKNCYVKGYSYIHERTDLRPEFLLKAVDCFFEAIDTNSNGRVNCFDIGEYYGNTEMYRVIFERCNFKSAHHAIEVGVGFGGLGTNKKLHLTDCKFMTGSEGWIVNNHPAYEFKLYNNISTTAETGSYPVVNLLAGSGFVIEPNLELFAP